MSRLSAAEAEVLFAGEMLGCFIETRNARGCACLGARCGRGRGRNNGGAGKGNSGSVCARGFQFARVGLIELDQVLLNPACAFDELGQCGGRSEVEELGREGGGKLVAEFSDGGMGVLIAAKLDIELVPLGQERVNCVVGLVMRRSMVANAVPYWSEPWKLSSSKRKADATSSASGSPSLMAWFNLSAATPANLEAMYRTPDSGVGYRQVLSLSLRRKACFQSL